MHKLIYTIFTLQNNIKLSKEALNEISKNVKNEQEIHDLVLKIQKYENKDLISILREIFILDKVVDKHISRNEVHNTNISFNSLSDYYNINTFTNINNPIINSHTIKPSKINLLDQYKYLKQQLKNITEINKIQENETCLIFGYVYYKKDDLVIEDESSVIKVRINRNIENVFVILEGCLCGKYFVGKIKLDKE